MVINDKDFVVFNWKFDSFNIMVWGVKVNVLSVGNLILLVVIVFMLRCLRIWVVNSVIVVLLLELVIFSIGYCMVCVNSLILLMIFIL